MNVEIRADAALFPEKEYVSAIFVAVYQAYAYQPCHCQSKGFVYAYS